jgi:hypothetical protein
MRTFMLAAAAAAALAAGIAAATPADAAAVIVGPRGGYVVYGRPYVHYGFYPGYPRFYGPRTYVAVGPHCWRSARVRLDGAVVYRRVCY